MGRFLKVRAATFMLLAGLASASSVVQAQETPVVIHAPIVT